MTKEMDLGDLGADVDPFLQYPLDMLDQLGQSLEADPHVLNRHDQGGVIRITDLKGAIFSFKQSILKGFQDGKNGAGSEPGAPSR